MLKKPDTAGRTTAAVDQRKNCAISIPVDGSDLMNSRVEVIYYLFVVLILS
ncbi:MAG: hypothetical protein Q8K00_19580 [Syntrophales bacterium]|nr:hypothetical protein [Syntrophales bacterium]